MVTDIAEISSQAPLDKDEIRRAVARSPRLANMVKAAQAAGLDFEVVEVAGIKIEEVEDVASIH